jgi:hypothetical protein
LRLGSAFLAGGVMLVALSQLATVLPLPESIRAPAIAPAVYGPAGERSGCTQADIDRSSGQTSPVDCHTMLPVISGGRG